MKSFDKLPKNAKKTIRYINQDASFEQLMLLKHHLNRAIEEREKGYYTNKSKS